MRVHVGNVVPGFRFRSIRGALACCSAKLAIDFRRLRPGAKFAFVKFAIQQRAILLQAEHMISKSHAIVE
jgi:hypothetical protein